MDRDFEDKKLAPLLPALDNPEIIYTVSRIFYQYKNLGEHSCWYYVFCCCFWRWACKCRPKTGSIIPIEWANRFKKWIVKVFLLLKYAKS